MKKILLSVLTASTLFANAQTGKAKPVVHKPVAPVCKNQFDSASYAVGMSVAMYYKKAGITSLNSTLVTKAINDILGGKAGVLDEASASMVLNNYINGLNAEKAKGNISAGEKFLAQNKTKPGVKTTASGLQYEVLTEGQGTRPTATDKVSVNYKGTFLDGTEFDNSYKNGQPVTFGLNQVIPGWTEGLQLMTPGSKYRFWVPYNLGYGVMGRQGMPGGSLLVFEVELLQVAK